jgi:hypothetical protein
MGNKPSTIRKIGFEDIKYLLQKENKFIIINTLHENEQQCLIKGTTTPRDEVTIINKALKSLSLKIIIYGKNYNDDTIYQKYQKLIELGFYNVYVYPGGIFEWLLLQDIYGEKEFPTTNKELDILKFKQPAVLNQLFLTNSS